MATLLVAGLDGIDRVELSWTWSSVQCEGPFFDCGLYRVWFIIYIVWFRYLFVIQFMTWLWCVCLSEIMNGDFKVCIRI